MAQQMIRDGDKDGDRALSKDEITQALQQRQNQMQNGPGWPGAFQGGPGAFQDGPRGPGGEQHQMIGQWLQYDRNGDHMGSADEVPRQAVGMLKGGDLD